MALEHKIAAGVSLLGHFIGYAKTCYATIKLDVFMLRKMHFEKRELLLQLLQRRRMYFVFNFNNGGLVAVEQHQVILMLRTDLAAINLGQDGIKVDAANLLGLAQGIKEKLFSC